MNEKKANLAADLEVVISLIEGYRAGTQPAFNEILDRMRALRSKILDGEQPECAMGCPFTSPEEFSRRTKEVISEALKSDPSFHELVKRANRF